MPKVAIFLSEGFADWECGLTLAALKAYYGVDIVSLAPSGVLVTSMGGLQVRVDLALSQFDPTHVDLLLLCGGSAWESPNRPDFSKVLQRAHAGQKGIAAICGAVQALAASGLLNDRPHTANSLEEIETAKGYAGHAHFVPSPRAVRADNIITAPGTAPVTFMQAVSQYLGFGGPELDQYASLHAAEHLQAA